MPSRKKVLVKIPLTTLDFYKYEKDGLTFYEFNATECQPPEPMVNAINALRMIKNKNERVKGTFFHEPSPLYAKISEFVSYDVKELENGDFEIIFALK